MRSKPTKLRTGKLLLRTVSVSWLSWVCVLGRITESLWHSLFSEKHSDLFLLGKKIKKGSQTNKQSSKQTNKQSLGYYTGQSTVLIRAPRLLPLKWNATDVNPMAGFQRERRWYSVFQSNDGIGEGTVPMKEHRLLRAVKLSMQYILRIWLHSHPACVWIWSLKQFSSSFSPTFGTIWTPHAKRAVRTRTPSINRFKYNVSRTSLSLGLCYKVTNSC